MSNLVELGYSWIGVNIASQYDIISNSSNLRTSSKVEVRCRVCHKEARCSIKKLCAGNKPCACGKRYYSSHAKRLEKLLPLLKECDYTFDGAQMDSAKTSLTLSCNKCHTSWQSSYDTFVNLSRRCPGCAGQYRRDKEEFVSDINAVGVDLHFKIVTLPDTPRTFDYTTLSCTRCSQEWTSSISNILTRRYSCPQCAKSGFNPNKSAYIYILSVKVAGLLAAYKFGISNLPKKRAENIKTAAPKDVEIGILFTRNF